MRWSIWTTFFGAFEASGSMRYKRSGKPPQNEENVASHELAARCQ